MWEFGKHIFLQKEISSFKFKPLQTHHFCAHYLIMEKLKRFANNGILVLKNHYSIPMFRQFLIFQNTLTAFKFAYLRWDKARSRFDRSKNTHLFNLLLSISLAANISLLLGFDLIYSRKKPDFEFVLSCVTFMWGCSGCFISAAMVFQRKILISFLNWYVTVNEALENGKHWYCMVLISNILCIHISFYSLPITIFNLFLFKN